MPDLVALLVLAPVLLTGCAAECKSSYAPPVAAAAIPELAPAARQSPIPAIYSSLCSTNLSSEIESWQRSLILPE
ncbi:hypothetical protein HX870_11205 [Pseudomonas gingeri]|nr:hypothetical protein [Pseudomonas gingeri]NWD68163.1 hypothetical protein [Pseudomonas gingeri]